jgi:hypothetical protein
MASFSGRSIGNWWLKLMVMTVREEVKYYYLFANSPFLHLQESDLGGAWNLSNDSM